MKLNGAQILAEVLLEQEVNTIFGYPGGAVIHIYEVLYEYRNKIKHVLTAHEQGASHAADGYARLSGKTGVVLASSGPGATNLITGIATAYMDSVPMVAITGNVPSHLIGKDSFQEVYTVGLSMPITKHNFVVQDIKELASTLREAFQIASSGRKGPVLVDITKDVTTAEYEFTPAPAVKCEAPVFENKDGVQEIARLLAKSKKPIVCYGGGAVASGASEVLHEVLHKAGLPAVHSLMGTGVLSWDDPLNMGLVGMHGNLSGNLALEYADLILGVGFRFSDRVALSPKTWAPNATIVQIDIDPSEVNKNVHVHHAVIGDMKLVLEELLPLLEPGKYDDWMTEISTWRKKDYKPEDSFDRLRPHQLIEIINETVGEDAVLVTDVGQNQMWTAQYCKRTKPRSFLTSGGLGTMGFGYGAAIGAQMAEPDRRVLHITGDGSFLMNFNECSTAMANGLPIVSVVFNNRSLGMVRQWQHVFYNDHFSQTDIECDIDFVKLAEGFGAKGYRVHTPEEFERVLKEALLSKTPVFIDCPIDKNEMVLPMIPAGKTLADTILG